MWFVVGGMWVGGGLLRCVKGLGWEGLGNMGGERGWGVVGDGRLEGGFWKAR